MELNIKELSDQFGIEFISIALIYNGSDNNIYCIVSRDKKYILRQSLRKKTMNDMNFEKNFSTFLLHKNIPVRSVISCGPLSLLSYCEGTSLTFSDITPVLAFNAGKILAEYHLVSKQFNHRPFPKRKMTSELERVSKVADKLQNLYLDGTEFVQNVRTILSSPFIVDEESCIIHNDFRIQNVLFIENKISAILDFDWACQGNQLKDLGHSLAEWSILDGNPIRTDLFVGFFKGYQSVIPDIELEKLKYWICFACLSDAATYLIDRIDEPKTYGPIRSWMYSKYLFFKDTNIQSFLR